MFVRTTTKKLYILKLSDIASSLIMLLKQDCEDLSKNASMTHNG